MLAQVATSLQCSTIALARLWDRRWGIHFRGMDAVGDAVGERASDALADEDWSDPLKVVQIC